MLNQIEGVLNPVAPYNFQFSLGFIQKFSPTRGEQSINPGSLTKAILIEGEPVVFRVENGGTVDSPCLRYTLFAERPITETQAATARDRIAFFLSLNDDLKPFYALGRDDPHFSAVIDRLYGLHQVKFLTPFENLIWAILTQRNRIANARVMKDAIVAKYGRSLTVDGVTYAAFPDAARMADATTEDIGGLIHHDQKAAYITGAVRAFLTVDESFLRTGDYAAVEAWLRAIKGVGEWSAKFVLIRGLGRTDSFGTEDALLDSASECYQEKLAPENLRELAVPYGKYQGYWAYYLRTNG
jgi:DNA-3-methyladenine glycosylase II